MLPNDICRCLGQLPTPTGTAPCFKREACQRYTQRYSGGGRTPISQWMCPGADDYWQYLIPAEVK